MIIEIIITIIFGLIIGYIVYKVRSAISKKKIEKNIIPKLKKQKEAGLKYFNQDRTLNKLIEVDPLKELENLNNEKEKEEQEVKEIKQEIKKTEETNKKDKKRVEGIPKNPLDLIK